MMRSSLMPRQIISDNFSLRPKSNGLKRYQEHFLNLFQAIHYFMFSSKFGKKMKQSLNQFLLLDFSYPMNSYILKMIIISLKNVLTLATAFPDNLKLFYFGISVMNSKFIIYESVVNLEKNYNQIISKLEDLAETSSITGKVTVPVYRHLLKQSIIKILQTVRATEEKCFSNNHLQKKEFKLTVVTKKTVPLLKDLLANIINKLPVTMMKKIKLVQILNDKENIPSIQQQNSTIEFSTCSTDIQSLEYIFKVWLFKRDAEGKIEIVLSEDLNLVVRCDVDECVINPKFHPFKVKPDFWDPIAFKPFYSGIEPCTNKEFIHLKILCRIPTSGVCSTFVFGIPHRIHATSCHELSWEKLEVNRKIFKELCEELLRTDEGLLAALHFPFEEKEMISYYYIISDGETLLLNNLATKELYMQQYHCLKMNTENDFNAASIVKTCLRNIKFVKEYSTTEFPSRMYEYLSYVLKKTIEKSSFLGSIDPTLKSSARPPPTNFRSNLEKKIIPNEESNVKKKAERNFHSKNDKEKPTSLKKQPENIDQKYHSKKRKKKDCEDENVHPALLPPHTVKKYKKHQLPSNKILELSETK